MDEEKPHLVLVHPGDRGNLGTIVRMAAGFQIRDVAIILPAVDRYHPIVVRASMGALFQIRCEAFHSFEEYRSRFHGHKLFPFLLNGDLRLTPENCPKEEKFALIFGNEATGLEEESFRSIGTSVTLPQSDRIDSLNLAIAAGIGTFLFASKNGLIG
ncbi:TrmH family RNA methyltransferase [Gorillibacterium sp. CAU 1737]|uniref:TrmH family RNA methyltransferase n=1 Tax=Gorillibacterium sp. CAU 1737 TaxID=3140362 RepID=UPI0032618C1A